MRELKTLHLASFNGNIGDNANHHGFYRALRELSSYKFTFTELEIREFYWKKRFFDEELVKYVNSFDLLIIGGGNYFELWVDDSPTGTSIMIEPELFKQISIPVIFNALGVDPGQGASDSACEKFKGFLDLIFSSDKNLISVRNDGAKANLANYIGETYAGKVFWTPDPGCNISTGINFMEITEKYMAINIAGDMLDIRFPERGGYESFLKNISDLIEDSLNSGNIKEVVLVPHIFRDLKCINELLEHLPDSIRRQNISIAPLLHGAGSEQKIFSIYENAVLSLTMRFHANLCSVALETPTVGLVNYVQIQKLYEEMDCFENAVLLEQPDYARQLKIKVESILNKNYFKEKQKAKNLSMRLKNDFFAYVSNLEMFLKENFK